MDAPDYVVCLDCETPCYLFEWLGNRLTEALCQICGNDDPDLFVRPEDLEELV